MLEDFLVIEPRIDPAAQNFSRKPFAINRPQHLKSEVVLYLFDLAAEFLNRDSCARKIHLAHVMGQQKTGDPDTRTDLALDTALEFVRLCADLGRV